MIIIGERINTVKPRIAEAIHARNSAYLQEQAIKQVEAGAEVIDANAGLTIDEPNTLKWLVQVVQEATSAPICVDSASAKAVVAGLEACADKANAWANSVTAEAARLDVILPVARDYGCNVVGLTIDERGIPATAEERVEAAQRIATAVDAAGIPLEKLYIDVCGQPVSLNPQYALIAARTIELIKRELSGIKTMMSLSVISYGLPARSSLHRAFVSMVMYLGIDAIMMDPLDKRLMGHIMSTRTALGQDEFCIGHIRAAKAGRLF